MEIDLRQKEHAEQILNKNPSEFDYFSKAIDSIKTRPIEREVKKWKAERDAMRVHISGTVATKLITDRRPCEDANIWAYRKANYEPITQPILHEAFVCIETIWNPTNYSYEFSEELENYVKNTEFYGYDFFGWFQNIMQPFVFEDAMGYIVALPGGEAIKNLDSSIHNQPYMKTVSCDSIVACEYEHGKLQLLVFKKHTHENVITDYEYVREYVILTPNGFYEIYYNGTDVIYEHSYLHEFGFVPAILCKGNWNTGKQMHQSFYSQFLPYANHLIRLESDHNASMVTCGYPVRVMQPIQCTAHNCSNGWINGIVGDGGTKCTVCKGTGKVAPSSPFGVYLTQEWNPALGDQNEMNPNNDPVRYVYCDTAILEYQSADKAEYLKAVKQSVYINPIDEAQSAVAKELDMYARHNNTLKIAKNSFGIVAFIAKCFELYLAPNSKNIPIINPPTVFQIKTESEIISEYQSLKTAKAPISRLKDMNIELIQKRYAGDRKMLARELFLMEYDPYFVYDLDEKAQLLTLQVIDLKQFQKSVNASAALDRVITRNELEVENYQGGGNRPEIIEISSENYELLTTLLDAEIEKMLPAPTVSPFDALLPNEPV